MKVFLTVVILLLAGFIVSTDSGLAREQKNKSDVYFLGGGDKLKINVFDEDDLSGEYEINGDGLISFPLIGDVLANGLTLKKLENLLITKLKDGYLINPKISIEVVTLRPFFIMGEVKNPGSYSYINSLTVLNAVAMAGGFTHRADEKKIIIKRKVSNSYKKIQVDENARIFPGDTIKIQERFF